MSVCHELLENKFQFQNIAKIKLNKLNKQIESYLDQVNEYVKKPNQKFAQSLTMHN